MLTSEAYLTEKHYINIPKCTIQNGRENTQKYYLKHKKHH